jgi:hypothetical protein
MIYRSFIERLDQLISRLLWAAPQPAADLPTRPAERALSAALIFSGLRCTMQYLILPIALPLLGIASGQSLGLMVLLDIIAIVSLGLGLRRFWQARHPRRWEYLAMAAAIIAVIAVFLWFDLRELL